MPAPAIRCGLLGPATLQFAEQVLPVHGDARQRVVDLMDDARGELAERGEFLRVDDLALELADFGPVSADHPKTPKPHTCEMSESKFHRAFFRRK